jgi:glycosyltransferase involved in cell wall biosynthesis
MKNKKIMFICAPVSSRSGYGDHARDLITSFMEKDEYTIYIIDVPWGDCPRDFLKKNKLEYKKMIDLLMTKSNQLTTQPDIYVDIRIPNEFETHGKFNIGITAGIETNVVSQQWLEGCNKMDLVIVPSEHSKRGFVETKYDKVKQNPDGKQEKIGTLQLEKPIEILFEGIDKVYKSLNKDEIDKGFFDWLNDEVPEKFAFLFVGQWVKGGYGEDRKDVGKLIKVFLEAFANKKKQPSLILKTSGATFSIMDYEDTKRKINEIKKHFPLEWKLPNVYLLHGDLSTKEMNYLYNHPKVKAMVSFTHGEGFGRPLLEATMVGLPVLAPGWSGQVDFLDRNLSLLMPGELKQIPESIVWENILVKEGQWINIEENIAYKALNEMYINNSEYQKKAKKLQSINKKFTLNKMTKALQTIMSKYYKVPNNDTPTQVGLNLPKLTRVE